MRLYRKEGNTVQILALPSGNVEKGDYLLIDDPTTHRSLIAQVIDVQFANVPGILEELLRNSTTNELVYEEEFDPLDIASHVTYIQDSRLLVCQDSRDHRR